MKGIIDGFLEAQFANDTALVEAYEAEKAAGGGLPLRPGVGPGPLTQAPPAVSPAPATGPLPPPQPTMPGSDVSRSGAASVPASYPPPAATVSAEAPAARVEVNVGADAAPPSPGAPPPAPRVKNFCKDCGAAFEADARFCGGCGARR